MWLSLIRQAVGKSSVHVNKDIIYSNQILFSNIPITLGVLYKTSTMSCLSPRTVFVTLKRWERVQRTTLYIFSPHKSLISWCRLAAEVRQRERDARRARIHSKVQTIKEHLKQHRNETSEAEWSIPWLLVGFIVMLGYCAYYVMQWFIIINFVPPTIIINNVIVSYILRHNYNFVTVTVHMLAMH